MGFWLHVGICKSVPSGPRQGQDAVQALQSHCGVLHAKLVPLRRVAAVKGPSELAFVQAWTLLCELRTKGFGLVVAFLKHGLGPDARHGCKQCIVR